MADPRKLILLDRLLSVQRAKRIGAEVTLADARERESEARSAEEVARADSRIAEERWFEHLAEPGFSLELGRNLSWHMLQSDEQVRQAECSTARRSEITAAKQGLWQIAEAQVRHSEASASRLRRAVNRKREEKRLADINDRMTFGWTRS